MSEIDDIFASKGKTKGVPLPLLSHFPSTPLLKKEKKSKKKKVDLSQDGTPPKPADTSNIASSSKKRPLPETVVDTSKHLEGPSKRQKFVANHDEDNNSKPHKVDQKKSSTDAEFKDSRGTGDRRTTEEGWLVYKEYELGIGDQGGGKPLRPI
ncbi:hypothetical protein GALMADRAFT_83573 [Galerina marginata CBS 339.88]|uniref:Uncharacterized protein n=1 Tax=Galerina marginata (strain CBS 339.88) TaxID=685588 RepID=A0A067TPJ9_GALM3|nr:hypothetical protein GALMADRAFT_83573 [Galerina marginata CBS 339.88]